MSAEASLPWATGRRGTSHERAEARELPASHAEDETLPGWAGLALAMH